MELNSKRQLPSETLKNSEEDLDLKIISIADDVESMKMMDAEGATTNDENMTA